jgi:hypothetical protein
VVSLYESQQGNDLSLKVTPFEGIMILAAHMGKSFLACFRSLYQISFLLATQLVMVREASLPTPCRTPCLLKKRRREHLES